MSLVGLFNSVSVSQKLPARMDLSGAGGGVRGRNLGSESDHFLYASSKINPCMILCLSSDMKDDFISPCGACRQVMREVSSVSVSLKCSCLSVFPSCRKQS